MARTEKTIGGGRPSRQFRNCQSWRRCNALASAWSGVIPDGAYCNRSSTAADGDPLRAASCRVTPAWHGFLTLNMYWVLGTCVRGHLLSFSPAVHSLGLASLQRLGDCVEWCDRHMLRTVMPISAVQACCVSWLHLAPS